MAFPYGYPSPWYTLTSTKRTNLFNPGDAVSFTIGTSGSYNWKLFNVNGLVSSGTATGTTLSLGTGLPNGWYRLQLFSGTTGCGGTAFIVMAPAPHLPSNPSPGTAGVPADPLFVGLDNVARAVLDIGPERWGFDPHYINTTGDNCPDLASTLLDIAHDVAWWGSVTDPARPRRPFVSLESSTGPYDSPELTGAGGNGPLIIPASASVNPSTTWVQVTAQSGSTFTIKVLTGPNAGSLTLQETWSCTAPSANEAYIAALNSSAYIRGFAQYQGFYPPAVQGPTRLSESAGVSLLSLVTSSVASLYAAGARLFELPYNEPQTPTFSPPNFSAGDAQMVAQVVANYRSAVLAGAGSARTMGPGDVSTIHVDPGQGDFLDSLLDWMQSQSQTASFDELSTHAYNGFNGDPWLGDSSYGLLTSTASNRGFGGRSVWMTEMGEPASCYGVVHARRQVSWGIRRLLMQERYGIPGEQSYFFYDSSHGFDAIPIWWKNADGTPTAVGAGTRQLSAARWGKNFATELSLGNAALYAKAYRFNQGSGSGAGDMVAIFTSGSLASTAKVTCNSSMTIQDVFGNTLATLGPGSTTISISDLPTYVLITAGATFAVNDIDGLMTASIISGGTDTTTGNATNISQIQAGATNQYFWSNNNGQLGGSSGGSPWYDSSGTVPIDIIRTWGTAQTMNGVAFLAMSPWQGLCTPLAFTVSALIGGTWVQQFSYANGTATSVAFQDGATECTVESYWDERWQFNCPFGATVSATAIKIHITALSQGGEPDSNAIAAGGQGTNTPQATIRAITPYLGAVTSFNNTEDGFPADRWSRPASGATVTELGYLETAFDALSTGDRAAEARIIRACSDADLMARLALFRASGVYGLMGPNRGP